MYIFPSKQPYTTPYKCCVWLFTGKYIHLINSTTGMNYLKKEGGDFLAASSHNLRTTGLILIKSYIGDLCTKFSSL